MGSAGTTVQLTEGSLLAEGLQFPEAPIAMPDGSIVFTEIAGERISRVRPTANGWSAVETVAEVPGGPNGLAVGPDGAFYCANNGGSFEWARVNGMILPGPRPDTWRGGSIDRIDPKTGVVTKLYSKATNADTDLRGPNDLMFDAHGGFWFTDHGTRTLRNADRTGIWYAKADGSKCEEKVHPVDGANGIGVSPDGGRVVWVETHSGRAYWREIVAPGEVAPADRITRGVLSVPGTGLFDSLAIDAQGNACVATIGPGGITSIAPDGTWTHYLMPTELFDPLTTNICFGGPDMRTAFITQSAFGKLIAVPWPTAGMKLAH
jgi:gluconolactonase